MKICQSWLSTRKKLSSYSSTDVPPCLVLLSNLFSDFSSLLTFLTWEFAGASATGRFVFFFSPLVRRWRSHWKITIDAKKKTYAWDIFNHICHLILSYKESGQFIEYVDDKRKICMENIHSFKGRKNLSRLLRYVLNQKKRYYLGIFPKPRAPPPHPPLLGTPYPKKNFSVYFAF